MALKLFVILNLALWYASIARRNPDDIKGLVSQSVTICGDDDIWNDITAPKTALAIKGIDWRGIDDTMKDYVSDHEHLVESSNTVINNYKKKIEEKKAKQVSRPITDEEIQNLVEQSVANSNSFGSRQAAETTACGKPGLKFEGSRPNPHGFENSKEVMQQVATDFFTPDVASEMMQFTRTCEDYLGFQRTGDTTADDLASFCDELCSEMAAVAQTISDRNGHGSKSDVRKLENLLRKEELKREDLNTKKVQCQDAIVKITNFRSYIEGLAKDMSKKHQTVQAAEWALASAEDVLQTLTGNLIQQQQAVEKAKSGLTDLGLAETQAAEELGTADAQMQVADSTLKSATDQWAVLKKDLEALRAAETYSDSVKERLSLLLLSMDGYVEECVREPVRNIGLSEETKVYDGEFFHWNVSTLPAKDDVNAALSAFHIYCATTATVAFEAVKDKVDLSPLCKLQPQESTLQEIVATVQTRKNSVVDSITRVQSWLDPFKGTNVNSANEVPEYVNLGEPLGLRRVMSMGLEKFYSGYLKKWKRHGEFLDLLASLTVAINDFDKKVGLATQEMEKAAQELESAEGKYETAVAALKQAETAASLEKEELNNALLDIENQVKQARMNLEDLKAKVMAAKLQWGISKMVLEKQHAAASESFAQKYVSISKLEE